MRTSRSDFPERSHSGICGASFSFFIWQLYPVTTLSARLCKDPLTVEDGTWYHEMKSETTRTLIKVLLLRSNLGSSHTRDDRAGIHVAPGIQSHVAL